MRKFLSSLIILLTVVIFSSVCGAADYKLGYISLDRAAAESAAGKAALEVFQSEVKKLEAVIMKEKEDIEKIGETFQKQSMMLTGDVRREKEKELVRRQRDYERMVKDSEAELKIKQAELTNDMLEELIPIVQQYGKDNKFTIIFEQAKSALLYADEALDCTDAIIALYDEQYQQNKKK